MTNETPKPSKVELAKEGSDFLAGDLADTLAGDAAGFSEDDKQVIKHHGVYQQLDRDTRGRADKPAPTFMVRSRIPGGILTAEQYLAHDELADRVGNGTLRITTRQALQLHGVLKGNLQSTLRTINDTLLTTLAACGDVVRNIISTPAPPRNKAEAEVHELAAELAAATLPRTRAYADVWLNGEPLDNPFGAGGTEGTDGADGTEPLYGSSYLPRKFKIAVALPGDNSTDVFAHDLGLVAIIERSKLRGFTVLVGGGMGMTHRKPETFPRLADPFTFVTPSRLIDTVIAIIKVQRDHGDRSNRRHARLKYLIHDKGLDWFRDQVEAVLGHPLRSPKPLPVLLPQLHLGWHEQSDDNLYLGVFIENGRIKEHTRAGLREIIRRFQPGIRLTPHQDVVLTDIAPADRDEIDGLLAAHGIQSPADLSLVRRNSMACPALPTCGLALAEAERHLPVFLDELETELVRLGLHDELINVRMTGCPNGCARPYVADIGLVGRSLDKYTVFVGGRSDGTRLNRPWADLVPSRKLVRTLVPLLELFRLHRLPGETFGDYTDRIGVDDLRRLLDELNRLTAPSGRMATVS